MRWPKPSTNICIVPTDGWEKNADWWQREFTDGVDVEYVEQIVPLARELLTGYSRVADVGTGEGQLARVLAGDGARVIGLDPTRNQIVEARARGGAPAYVQAGAAALPLASGSCDAVLACLVFEHIDDVDGALHEVGRILRPGGRFVFMLNHPLLQTPESGWIDDHVMEPPEQYWRLGPYLREASTMEEVQKDVYIRFVHRPLHRYVNGLVAAGDVDHEDAGAGPAPGLRRSCPRIPRCRHHPASACPGGGAAAVATLWFMADYVLITGLSGAGRSEAAKHLEDLGYFVIDNLPPSLMPKVAELAAVPGSKIERVALVMGTGAYSEEMPAALAQLRETSDDPVRVLFLSARTPVIVRRYEATRRRHPFHDGGSLQQAIDNERAELEIIRAEADLEIDTSDLNVHQLRQRILETFGGVDDDRMQTRVVSFGYKHGLPVDVDIVMDCRFLPNPHWVEDLRPQTGLDGPVRSYVLAQPATQAFLDRMRNLIELLVPAYQREGKAYLTLAFGCTGGHHRSVVIAEQVAEQLRSIGLAPSVTHRDIDR